jgi:hypothetical protein
VQVRGRVHRHSKLSSMPGYGGEIAP